MKRKATRVKRRESILALTEREKAILRLKTDGLSDYKIAHKLKMDTPKVTRARINALKKIEFARADLQFVDGLIGHHPHR